MIRVAVYTGQQKLFSLFIDPKQEKSATESRMHAPKVLQICKPENRLLLPWETEIWCQTLVAFESHRLSYFDLVKVQKIVPLVLPWDQDYSQLRLAYNRKFTYFPMGILHAKTVDDIRLGILWCRKYHLNFVIASGRHCFEPFCLSDEIILDVSQLNKIRVFKNSESLRLQRNHSKRFGSIIRSHYLVELGPGARLGQVAEFISKKGLSLVLGSCKSVNCSGLTLGGGISPSLCRYGGMACDHLYSATLVLANGKVKTIKGSRHPECTQKDRDLMWALRGAGAGNFGVIVNLVLNPCLFKGAVVFKYIFSWRDFFHVVKSWQDFAPFANPKLSCELVLRSPKHSDSPLEVKGQCESSLVEFTYIIAKFWQSLEGIQPAAKTEKEIQNFAESALFWGTTEQTYFEANSIFFQHSLKRQIWSIYQHFMEIAERLDTVSFDAMGGHIARYENLSCFPWRNSRFWALHQGKTLSPQYLFQHELWVRRLYRELVPYAKIYKHIVPSYVNAPQRTLSKKFRYLWSYYGQNVFRLLTIKKRVDPENAFHFEQSLPVIDNLHICKETPDGKPIRSKKASSHPINDH